MKKKFFTKVHVPVFKKTVKPSFFYFLSFCEILHVVPGSKILKKKKGFFQETVISSKLVFACGSVGSNFSLFRLMVQFMLRTGVVLISLSFKYKYFEL